MNKKLVEQFVEMFLLWQEDMFEIYNLEQHKDFEKTYAKIFQKWRKDMFHIKSKYEGGLLDTAECFKMMNDCRNKTIAAFLDVNHGLLLNSLLRFVDQGNAEFVMNINGKKFSMPLKMTV